LTQSAKDQRQHDRAAGALELTGVAQGGGAESGGLVAMVPAKRQLMTGQTENLTPRSPLLDDSVSNPKTELQSGKTTAPFEFLRLVFESMNGNILVSSTVSVSITGHLPIVVTITMSIYNIATVKLMPDDLDFVAGKLKVDSVFFGFN
jgi:hypothetical protein